MFRMRKCPGGHYTMKATCACGKRAVSAHPPKFSARYAKYRIK